jgi:hypothetical protein
MRSGARAKTSAVLVSLLASVLCAPALAAAAAWRAASSRGPLTPSASRGRARAASPATQPQTAQSKTRSRPAQSKPAAGAKVYRGSIGGRGVEVSLGREGGRVSGSYRYDGIAESLRLEGRAGGDGKLTLDEYDGAGRQTGKFACEPGGGDAVALDIDLECEWSKPDGAERTYAGLTEQHAGFTRAWRVGPRQIANRRYGVGVTYPQIVAARGAKLTAGALGFNRRAAALAAEIVRKFTSQPHEQGMYLKINYDVLLATDDLVSVELEEENDHGGGRPNTSYYGLTYDLRAGRELRLADLFKPDSGFERVLLLHAYEGINRRYRGINRREAAAGGPPSEGGELMQQDRGDEIAAWAMTTRGVVIYFNFPQVMAVFDRNFVPYPALSEQLRPGGPAAAYARE